MPTGRRYSPCIWRARGLCATPPGERCHTHCQCMACVNCPRAPAGPHQSIRRARTIWRTKCNHCNKYCTRGNSTAVWGTAQQYETHGFLVPPLPSEGWEAPSPVHVPSIPPPVHVPSIPLALTQPCATSGTWQGTLAARSVDTMDGVAAPASASGFYVTRRLASDLTSVGTWNRHDAPFPIGVACVERIDRDLLLRGPLAREQGIPVVTQVHFLCPGSGELDLPVTIGQQTAQATRVALSWILLHFQDVRRLCGRDDGELLDLWRKRGEVDVAVTMNGAMGKLDGYSVGLLLLVSMFTSLTGCRPVAKTAMSGEVTLEGLVLGVGKIDIKATAAAQAGLHNFVVPVANDGEGYPLSEESRSLHVQGVETVAQALQHTLQGWRRVPITLTPPRSYLAVMHVPVTYHQAVEVEKLEIAVLPGTGQMHITGQANESVDACLRVPVVFIRGHMQHIETAITRAIGRPVRWRFDLGTMRWMDGSDGLIDVHMNLPNANYTKVAPVYGAAATVGLLSLMAGLAVPANLGIAAHISGSGRLAPCVLARLATAQGSADAGLHTLYLADHDAEQLRREIANHPHEVDHDMQLIGRPAIPELLLDVFKGAMEF